MTGPAATTSGAGAGHPRPGTLRELFALRALGEDRFEAWTPAGTGRPDIFGGQVAGQALAAAGRTVRPGHLPNSVHCYFLRRGQPALPLELCVERVREGRTYTSRRVDVRQEGRSIFAMLASFHAEEPGVEVEHRMPADVVGPEHLAGEVDPGGWQLGFDVRLLPGGGPEIRWWGRVSEAYPDEPLLQYCALLYASDFRSGGAAIAAAGYASGDRLGMGEDGQPLGNFGSLDHALWFHRPPDPREWFFCDVRPLIVRDGRGLVLGSIFDAAGRHLATLAQEMFLKVPGTPEAPNSSIT